jgi:hypothetical protein
MDCLMPSVAQGNIAPTVIRVPATRSCPGTGMKVRGVAPMQQRRHQAALRHLATSTCRERTESSHEPRSLPGTRRNASRTSTHANLGTLLEAARKPLSTSATPARQPSAWQWCATGRTAALMLCLGGRRLGPCTLDHVRRSAAARERHDEIGSAVLQRGLVSYRTGCAGAATQRQP